MHRVRSCCQLLLFTGALALACSAAAPPAAGSCVPTPTALCISDQPGDSRFQVQVAWSTSQGGGQSGMGNAVATTPIGFSQGGIFWFFSSSNPEMLVKVLNGCSSNQKYWVFASAGTNVGLNITVTDTVTGTTTSYTNPDLTPAQPVQDTAAFPCGGGGGGGGAQEVTVTLPGGVPLVMVKIPAGTFQMGSPGTERNRDFDETLHQVTVTSDYYMGKYAVTQGQWRAVTGSNPSYFLSCGDSCPVEQVSWNDTAGSGGFVEKLNQYLSSTGQPGAGKFRLPTEAEWERAARGGTTTRFSFGDALNGDDLCGVNADTDPYVWWCGNSGNTTHTVGSKAANPYGLYDVHGNVWDWVQDWYGDYPSSAQTNPTGPTSGSYRVVRAGSWDDYARSARSANRSSDDPNAHAINIGFRLAMSL